MLSTPFARRVVVLFQSVFQPELSPRRFFMLLFALRHVRYGSEADIGARLCLVRFVP